MIRVLHILPTLNVCGGIENFAMNYYRFIDRSRIQFDFLVHELGEENFRSEAEGLGAHVYLLPGFSMGRLPSICRLLQKFYAEHREYRIIHCHMANAAAFHFFYAGRGAVRVLHSHQPVSSDEYLHVLRNYCLLCMANRMADARCASSEIAGRRLFGGRRFRLIKNAVDAALLKTSLQYRDEMRKKTGLTDRFVLGHVGRFAPVKNHEFLLEILLNMIHVRPDVMLCLIGEGKYGKEILRKIVEKNLENHVRIISPTGDIYRYYGVFDVFLLPSLFEGLGMAAVEAQYAGIRVIAAAGRVPPEAKISNYLEFVPLEAGAAGWINKILELQACREERCVFHDDYDIRTQAANLARYYEELSDGHGA